MKLKYMSIFLLASAAVTLPLQAGSPPQPKPPIVTNLPVNNKSTSTVIDLNKADLSQLTGSFKGIGKKRAEAIIAYRESHNGFKSLEELAEVKGIGQHFLDTHRAKLKDVYVIN